MCKRVLLSLGFLLLSVSRADAQRLINIDFGAHTNPAFSIKTGKAAAGLTDQDYWNLYSRDGANGEFLSSSQLLNLKLSDGTVTEADLYVTGAPGAWYTLNPDPMFQSYLYPGNPNINIILTNLPTAKYDIYVYAHGQPASENSVIHVTAGNLVVGEKATSTASNWDSFGWVEGNQYVLFKNVSVDPTTRLSIVSKRGAANMAVINGIQLMETVPAPSNSVITIEQQPRDSLVAIGTDAELVVAASSDLPLSYQWIFNGNILSNATASTLRIDNVTAANVGKYRVTISNSGAAAVSSDASLQVYKAVSDPLLNIDFGAHLNPFLHAKTGPAAVGSGLNDQWNLYSRDGVDGSWLDNSFLSELRWSDGTPSGIRLDVSNAAGAWYTFHPDAMFESYLYPISRAGNINSALTGLPPGTYDVLVYAHGQISSENAVVRVTTNSSDLGLKVSSSAPDWNSPAWTEGNHYLHFRNVFVRPGERLTISSKPGQSGLAVINGLQLVQKSTNAPTSISITRQPADALVQEGGIADFTVLATNSTSLKYQWYFNNSQIAHATNPLYRVENASSNHVGSYHVEISSNTDSVISASARLQIFVPVNGPILNIDYGAHLNPYLHSKTGPAAVGINLDDRWNLYSRDGTNGAFLSSNRLSNLVWSDGSSSSISITVTNAGGAWYTLNPDPMFESYLYPLSRTGNIGSIISNLTSGKYDVYVYAHGQIPSENGVIAVSSGSTSYGVKSTSSDSNWDSAFWLEGRQYVRFTDVVIGVGENLNITALPGQTGLAVINGVQLVQKQLNLAVADWTFEEGVLGAHVSSARDFSGNDRHITSVLGGSASFVATHSSADGAISASLPPGQGGSGNALRAPDSSAYNLRSEFTVEVSLIPGADNATWNRGVVVGQDVNSGRLAYALDYRSEGRTIGFVVSDSGGQIESVTANIPDDAKSHHVAGVYSAGTLKIYLDKILVQTKSTGLVPGFSPSGAGRVTLGANDIGGYWFHGVLDRVRISREALPPDRFFAIQTAPGNPVAIIQPLSDLTIQTGASATFQVGAVGSGALTYKWLFNDQLITNQTSNALVVSNVQSWNSGEYRVVVSNAENLQVSSAATLKVYTAVEAPLVNIDFGAHQNPVFTTNVGPAAIGRALGDRWNLYSRDNGSGGWLANNELSNLIWSDGSNSTIRLTVTNAAGAWFTLNPDPMFESYLYPLSRSGNIGAKLSRLPAGKYDLIVYAHGQIPSENGVVQVNTETASFGTKTNSSGSDWDPGFWLEGAQYVRFSNVVVQTSETLSITVRPGNSGLAVINGLQLVLKEGLPVEFNATVADWTFEEGTVGSQVRSALDSSANGLHITQVLGGSAVFIPTDESTAGAVSVSLPSGNGGFGNALRAPDSTEFILGGQFTVEVSVSPGTDNDTWNRGVVVGQDATSGRLAYALDYRSENRALNFAIINSQGEGDNVTAHIPNDGISHHVAGVYSAGILKIYLDKTLVATKTTTLIPGLTPGGAGRVTLGANDIGGYWFQGILDRVRISREALSPERFFQHRRDTNAPLTILQPLQNITVDQGGVAAFQVTATGPSAISYLWRHNDAIIPHQTNSTLTLHNVQPTNAGTYKVSLASGPWEATSTAVLTINQPTNSAPTIITQPLSRHVPIGQDVQFSVVAAGSPPLTYQWKWDGLPLVGKTSSTLTLNDVSTLHVGQYSVEVRNDLGFTNSIPALLTVFAPDTNAPVVVITSPIDGTIQTNRVTFAGTISGTITRAEWFRNRQLVGSLHLTNGGFSIPNILLATGTNTFMVRAYNEVGGVGTASVTVILETNRAIWIGSSASVQEGARVNLPIFISSSGEIGALSFSVLYDTNYLTTPELSFLNQESGAFTQVNLDSPGVIRATYVLPGRTLPAGHDTTFASVRFRTRSVPLSMTTPVQLELLGLYSAAGDPIASGTSVGSGEVPIVQRKYIGDNNANDRLDIADATVIIRMITLLDPIRSWDVTGNDLNSNSSLDAGDIVRVLRAVVNLDPQPSGQNGPLLAAASAPNAKISLSSSSARLTPGGQIKILISLADLGQPLSGASFRLNYPAGALRLESSSAHSAGSLVPQNSLTMWNVLPEQNYAQQSGTILFAASSATAWSASAGAIAELNFTVLPAAASQYAWPLRVSQAEAAAGLDPVSFGTAEILLTGRDAQPAELAEVALDLDADAIQLRLIGEAGVRYQVMSSTNLVDWTEVGVYSDASGAVLISDPIDPDAAQKFYRATQLD